MNIVEGQVRVDPDDNETIRILKINDNAVRYEILVRSSHAMDAYPVGKIVDHSVSFVRYYFTKIDETYMVEQLLKEYELH